MNVNGASLPQPVLNAHRPTLKPEAGGFKIITISVLNDFRQCAITQVSRSVDCVSYAVENLVSIFHPCMQFIPFL